MPTPIGNLGDITKRSIEVLSNVEIILAEDTRVTARLLKHLGIVKPLKSFHAHNEHKVLQVYGDMVANGTDIALVTDAGTPAISDPGFLLARYCRERNLPVNCLPGPTAFVPALVVSGLPCDKFYFEGFLPVKKGRQTRLKGLATCPCTIILYESPHKIIKTLEHLIPYLGMERQATLCRELSKLHEEVLHGTLHSILEDLSQRKTIKGEIVLVIAGSDY